MPVFAHFHDLPQEGERRRSARRALSLGAGAGGDVRHHPRHLADTGMLLEPTPMLSGRFEVELPHAGKVAVAVVWNSGDSTAASSNIRSLPPRSAPRACKASPSR